MGGFLTGVTGKLFEKTIDLSGADDPQEELKSMIQDGLKSVMEAVNDAIDEHVGVNQLVNDAEINLDGVNVQNAPTENESMLNDALNVQTQDPKTSIASYVLHGFSDRGVIDLGSLSQFLHGDGDIDAKDLKNLKFVNDLGIDLDSFKRMVDVNKPETNKGYVRFSKVKGDANRLKLDSFGKTIVCLNVRQNVSASYNKQMRFLFANSLMKDWGGLVGLQGDFHCKTLAKILGDVTKHVLKPEKNGVQGSIGDLLSTEEVARAIKEYNSEILNEQNLENIGLDFMRECYKACTHEEPSDNKGEFLSQVDRLLEKFSAKADVGLIGGLFGNLGEPSAARLLDNFKGQQSVKYLQTLMRDTAQAFGEMRVAKETQEAAQSMLSSLKANPNAMFAIRDTDHDFYHKLRTAIFGAERANQLSSEETGYLNDFVNDIAPKYVEKVLTRHADSPDPVGAQNAVLKDLDVGKFKELFDEYRQARQEWKNETCSPFDSIIADLEVEKQELMQQAMKLAERPGELSDAEKEQFAQINEKHQKVCAEIDFVRAQQLTQKQTNGTFDLKGDAFLDSVISFEADNSGDAPAVKKSVRDILQEGVQNLQNEYKIHWKTQQFLRDKLDIEVDLPKSAVDTFNKVKENFRQVMTKAVKINISTDSVKSVSEVANILSFALCSEGALDPLRNAISPVSKAENPAVAEFAKEGGKKLIDALQTALVKSLNSKLEDRQELDLLQTTKPRAEIVVKQMVAKLTNIQQRRFNLPFLKAPIVRELGNIILMAKRRGELTENDAADLSTRFKGKALDAVITGVSRFLDQELPGLLSISLDPKFADAVDRKLNAVISRAITKSTQEALADVYEKVRNVRIERNRTVDLSNQNLSSSESLDQGGLREVDLDDEFKSFRQDFKLEDSTVILNHQTHPFGIDAQTVATKLKAQLEHVWQDEMVSCPPGATGNCVLDTVISIFKNAIGDKDDDSKVEAEAPEAQKNEGDSNSKVGTEDWLNKRKANVRNRMEAMVSRYFDFERNVIDACARMTLRTLEKQVDGFAELDPSVQNEMCKAALVKFQSKITAELTEFLDNPHAYGGSIRNLLEKMGNALGDFLSKDGLINFSSKDIISPMDKMAVDIMHLQEWDIKLPKEDQADDGIVLLTDMIRTNEKSQGLKDLLSGYSDAMKEYRGRVDRWLGDMQMQSAAIDMTKGIEQLKDAVEAKGLQAQDVDELVRVANEIVRSRVKVEKRYIKNEFHLQQLIAHDAAQLVIELLDKTDLVDNLATLKADLAKAADGFLDGEVRVDGATDEGVKSIADKLAQSAETQKNAFIATFLKQYDADRKITKSTDAMSASFKIFEDNLKSLAGKLAQIEQGLFAQLDGECKDSVKVFQDELSRRGFDRREVLASAEKLLGDETDAFKKSFSAQLRSGIAMNDLDPSRLGEANANAHAINDMRVKLNALVQDRIDSLTKGSLELTIGGFAGLLRKNGAFAKVDDKLFEKAAGIVFCQGCRICPASVDADVFKELNGIVSKDKYISSLLKRTFDLGMDLSADLGSLVGANFRDRFYHLVNNVVANGAQGEAELKEFGDAMRSIVGSIIAHFDNGAAYEKNLDVRLKTFIGQKLGGDVISADDFKSTCERLESSIKRLREEKSTWIDSVSSNRPEADGWETYREKVELAFSVANSSFKYYTAKNKCLNWFSHQQGFEAIINKLVAKDESLRALFVPSANAEVGPSEIAEDMANVMSTNRAQLRRVLSGVIGKYCEKWPNGREDIARALEDGSLVELVEGDESFKSTVVRAREEVGQVDMHRQYISDTTAWVKKSVREYLTKFVIDKCFNRKTAKFEAYIKRYHLGTLDDVDPRMVIRSMQGWLPEDERKIGSGVMTYDEYMTSFANRLENALMGMLKEGGHVFDPDKMTVFKNKNVAGSIYIDDFFKDKSVVLDEFGNAFTRMARSVATAGQNAQMELGKMLKLNLTQTAMDWIGKRSGQLAALGLDVGQNTLLVENDFVKNIQAELNKRIIDPALEKLAEGIVYRRPEGKLDLDEIDPKFYNDLNTQVVKFMQDTFDRGVRRLDNLNLKATRDGLEFHLRQMPWFSRANYKVFGDKADEIYRRALDSFVSRFSGSVSKDGGINWLNSYWNNRLKAFKVRCFDPSITDDKDVMAGERLLDVTDAVEDRDLVFFADLYTAEVEVRQQALLEQARIVAATAIEAYKPPEGVTFTDSDREVLEKAVMKALDDKDPRNFDLRECMVELDEVRRQTSGNRQTLLAPASTAGEDPTAGFEKWLAAFSAGIDDYITRFARMRSNQTQFGDILERTLVHKMLEPVMGDGLQYSFATALKENAKAKDVTVHLVKEWVNMKFENVKSKSDKNKPDAKLIERQVRINKMFDDLMDELNAKLKEFKRNRWTNDVMHLKVEFDETGSNKIDMLKTVAGDKEKMRQYKDLVKEIQSVYKNM